MDIAAERIFGLWRGATSGHIRSDLDARSDKATGQKDLSPKGFAKNGPATSLFLSRRPIKDMLLPQVRTDKSCPHLRAASSAGRFWRNSNIHSLLTGC